MSQTVDQRIVEMRFDNKQFEDGTKTTLSTLEKLKSALKFDKATDGFSDLSDAAKHCDVSHLGSAVDSIAERFSNMGIIGMRTLQNLADSAYNAGTKILKSLTLDPITQGYAKYEKKTAAVSTMLAQGFDQSEIDEELGKLQWFADETSYTFTDMVDSVSKFTASGQGLSDSVTALQGIALWASSAGQSAATASRAMYQLSQAMGSGQMRKQDWMSVQNANMDTKEFREMALQAGVRQGTVKRLDNGNWKSLMVKDGAEFSTSQFAEHLTEDAWFTRDVMMDVYQSYASVTDKVKEFAETQDTTTREAIVQIKELKDLNLDNADAVQAFADKYDLLEEDVPKFKKMADACDEFGLKTFEAAQATKTFQELIDALQEAVASSWGTIFEYVIGNAEEAKELYSNLADGIWDYFNAVTDGLKEILGPWHDHMYGRQSILNGITYAFQNIIAVVDAVGEAFSEMFPPMKSWDLIAFSMKFEEFMEKLVISEQTVEDIKNVFKGFFGVLRIGLNVVTTTANFAFDIFSKIVGAIFPAFSAGGGSILHFFGNIGSAIGDFASSLGSLGGRWNKIWQVLAKLNVIVDPVINAIKMAVDWVTGLLAKIDFAKIAENFVAGFNVVMAFFEPFKISIYDGITAIGNFIAAFDLSSITGKIKAFFEPLLQFLGLTNDMTRSMPGESSLSGFASFLKPMGLYASLLEKLPGISTDASGALTILGVSLHDFADKSTREAAKLSIYQQITDRLNQFKTTLGNIKTSIVDSFKKIRNDVSTFLAPVKEALSKFIDWAKQQDWRRIFTMGGTGFIAGTYLFNLLNTIKTVRSTFGNIGDFITGVSKGAADFANNFIGTIKTFADGFNTTMNSVRSTLEAFQSNLKVKFFKEMAFALVGLAAAFLIISKWVDPDRLLPSFEAMSGLIAVLTIALLILNGMAKRHIGKDGGQYVQILDSLGKTFLLMSIGLAALTAGLAKLAILKDDQIAHGIQALVAISAIVFGLSYLMSKYVDDYNALTKAALGMIVLAVAVRIMAGAIAMFSVTAKDGPITNGLIQMALVIGLLAAFVVIAGRTKLDQVQGDMINIAAGLLILSVALLAMSKVLDVFQKIPVDEYFSGLFKVAGVLIALAIFVRSTVDSNQVFGAAVGMIALAVALLIFKKAMDLFAKMEIADLAKGLITLYLVIFALAFFVSETANSKGVLSAAVSMVILAGAVIMLAGVMALLSLIPFDKLVVGAVGLAVALGALLGAAYIINKLGNTNWSGILGLVVLAVVIDMVAAALTLLAIMPWQGILAGASAIVALLVVMTLIMAALSNFGAFSVIAASSFLILAAAVFVLALAIPMLATGLLTLIPLIVAFAEISKGDTIATGLSALAAVVAGFADAIYILAKAIAVFGLAVLLAGTGAVVLGIGLGLVGAGALIAAAGLTIFIGALALVASVFTLICELIESHSDSIINAATTVADSIKIILYAIINAIADAIPIFLEKLAEGIIRFFEVLQEGKQKLKMAALEAMLEFAAALRAAAPTLADTAVFLIRTFLLAIYDALVSLVTIVGAGILKAVEILQPYVEVAMARIAQTIINSLINILEVAASLIPVFGSDLVNGLEEAKDRVNETIGSIDTKALGETSIDGIIDGLRGKDDEITAAGSKVGKGVTNAYEAVAGEEKTKAQGEKSALGFISGLISGSGSFPTDGAAIGDTILSTLNVSDEAGMVGGDVFSSFTDSFASEENLDYSKMVGGLVGTSSLDGITELDTDFFNAGELSVDGFTQGLTSPESMKAMMTSGNTMGITSLDGITTALGIHSPSTQFRNVGIYSVNGFVAGLAGKNSIAKVSEASRRVAEAALRAMNQRLDIHSPSKEFAKIGKYADEGLAQGLTDNKGVVEQAAIGTGASTNDKLYNFLHEVFTDTMDQMTILFDDAAHRISDGFADLGFTCGESLTNNVAEGIDMEAVTSEIELPEDLADQEMTITPVIDYSQIQNDSSYLDEMLGDKTIGISDTAIDSANDAGSNITAKLDEINGNLIGIKEEAIEVLVDLTRIIQAGIDKGQTVNVEIRNEVGGKTVAYEQRTFNTAEQQRVGKSYTGKG